MSRQSSIADMDALVLGKLFRKRELSPTEVIEAVLQRIAACEPKLNAFAYRDPEAARADASASTERWAKGQPLSDLDGVPVTVKDLVLASGWPTLRGSNTVDINQKWTVDAPAVQRLREAGTVILGKTSTPEFGWKGVCDSPLGGTTRNPWNERMTPGGSSGGAAVAAATGMGCLHIGTDGGGSIRIPSAFTGIFGLKPTFGLVPAFPLSPFGRVAHLGPMTRTVSDAARMLTLIAKPDARDWHSQPYNARDYLVGLDEGVKGLRIALSYDLGYAKVDPEIRGAIKVAAERLSDLGAIVEEKNPGFSDPREIFEAHWWSGAANLRRSITREKWGLMEAGLQKFADLGEKIGHMEYLAAMDACGALGTQMALFHERYDALLTPTMPITAFEVNHVAPPGQEQDTWLPWSPFTYPFNLTQQPAASIPCGFHTNGLPIGMQIVGAKYRDDLVLRIARACESVAPFAMPKV